MHRALIVSIAWATGVAVPPARALTSIQLAASIPARPSIHKIEELTWPQIDALDRERTMFILPVGAIEEHGPHLPVGTDTYGVMHEVNEASTRVSRALPDWSIVLMPPITYGQGGANVIGDLLVHPGTYGIRQSTLRSLVADLGGEIAQNGFKRINASHFSAAERQSFGMDVHAGVGETSAMLALRPDLVRSTYKTLPSRAGRSFDDLRDIATAPGWQGYLSSPAKATASYGRAVEAWWVDGFTDLIVRTVRGENMFAHARVPERVPPPVAPLLAKVLASEAAFEAKLESWLEQRSKR